MNCGYVNFLEKFSIMFILPANGKNQAFANHYLKEQSTTWVVITVDNRSQRCPELCKKKKFNGQNIMKIKVPDSWWLTVACDSM